MKKVKLSDILNIALPTTLTAVVFAVSVLAPHPAYSDIEQRELNKMPAFNLGDLLSGKYEKEVREYYDDTIPYRDSLKRISYNIKNLFGLSFDNAEFVNVKTEITAPAVTETSEPPPTETIRKEVATEKTAEEINPEPAPPENAEGVYNNGQIIVKEKSGHWRGISVYGGGTADRYAAALNTIKKKTENNVNVYSMVVPTSGDFYTPQNFKKYTASQYDTIKEISQKLEGVKSVELQAYSALQTHKDEPVYTRTDHHWFQLGAYYAAKEFAKAANVPFADLNEQNYTKEIIPKYVGTMYSFTKSARIQNDPEDFTYYKPKNSYKASYYDTNYNFLYDFPMFVPGMPVNSSYSVFFGGDAKIVRIDTDVHNNRTLLLFKDSYGNAEVPNLTGSFETIYVCDIRYFKPNIFDFIKQHNVTDLLFSVCTFSTQSPNVKYIEQLAKN
jgi:hypothetical protein